MFLTFSTPNSIHSQTSECAECICGHVVGRIKLLSYLILFNICPACKVRLQKTVFLLSMQQIVQGFADECFFLLPLFFKIIEFDDLYNFSMTVYGRTPKWSHLPEQLQLSLEHIDNCMANLNCCAKLKVHYEILKIYPSH